MVVTCDLGNKLWGVTQCGEFLEYRRNVNFSRRAVLQGISYDDILMKLGHLSP